MARYTGKLRNPSDVARSGAVPQLKIKLNRPAFRGDTLVNDEPVIVTAFGSDGSFTVDLIPNIDMDGRHGGTFYEVEEHWFGTDGAPVSWAYWPHRLVLGPMGGPLTSNTASPFPSPANIYRNLTPPPVGSGFMWWLDASPTPVAPGMDPGTGNLYFIPGGA